MTIKEKQRELARYCENSVCGTCKINNMVRLLGISDCLHVREAVEEKRLDIALEYIGEDNKKLKPLDGIKGAVKMEKQTITISVERFEELVKKETLLEQLTKGKEIEMYLKNKDGGKTYA